MGGLRALAGLAESWRGYVPASCVLASLRGPRPTLCAASLATTALERETFAGAYADQWIANAQALAAALSEAGLDVLGQGRGFTASHHIALDARSHGGGTQAARTLAAGGILLSEIGIPRDPAAGLRIGTQAITRQGFVEADMPAIAEAFAAILNGEPADVPALRRRHTGLQFTLSSGSA